MKPDDASICTCMYMLCMDAYQCKGWPLNSDSCSLLCARSIYIAQWLNIERFASNSIPNIVWLYTTITCNHGYTLL